MANAIRKLADDPQIRVDLGRCARAYAEMYFDRDAILERIFGPADGHVASVVNDCENQLGVG